MTKRVGTMSWGAALAAVFIAVLVCAGQCLAYNQGDPEFRAVWIDAWGAGYMSQAQVDQLLGVVGDPNSQGEIRNANCNAVIIEVRRRADRCYKSDLGEPWMTGLTPSDFNALKAVIDAAHDTTGGKQRIEVHAWLVTFATASGVTGPVYYLHNNPADADNYWCTRDNAGNETSDKAFDPGHPKCEEYITNICMELVNNFEIDGVHFDYIRFTGENQGYNPTSIARYNARYGLTGKPSYSNEQFKQWRRDQVSAVVRKVYAKTQASKPAVKVSGSFVTWNPSAADSTREAFQGTRPYYQVYSDWDAWMQEGILDMSVPMDYYNWATSGYSTDFIRWMNFTKDRKFNRHGMVGVGTGSNSLDNAIREILMTRDPSTKYGNYGQGFSIYSYGGPYSGGTWNTFSQRLVSDVCLTKAEIPGMPWKTNPTKGHISGMVTHIPGDVWADGATVSISGPEDRSMLCDGTGFYAFIDLTPGIYTVTASKDGCVAQGRQVTVAIGNVTGNMYVTDFALITAPIITNVRPSDITMDAATIAWDTDQPSSSQVEYGLTASYGLTTLLDMTQVAAHSVALSGLGENTLYHYRVTSANGNGSRTSADYTFTTGTHSLTLIPNPSAGGACTGSGWYVTDTSVSASADVNPGYFLTSWSTNADGTGVVSGSNPYVFNMPAGNLTLYANLQMSVADIIIEAETGGSHHDWYTEVGLAHSSAKSSAAGCTPLIGSRYGLIDTSTNKSAMYLPAITFDGWYEVSVTWGSSFSGGSTIKHTVTHRDGGYTRNYNQATNGSLSNKWNVIGTFPFLVGASGVGPAALTQWVDATQASKRLMADAAKWVYVGPFAATNPNPADAATGAAANNPTLRWAAGGATGSYDVYFGASTASMAKVSSSQTDTSFTADTLAPSTTYYWRIDSFCLGKTTTGSTWSFTTAALPTAPSAPDPPSGSARVSESGQTLSWTGGGSDVAYDVYFGTTPPGALVSTHQSGTSYATGALAAPTPYYWRVVAFNASDDSASGPVWSFTTAGPITCISAAKKLPDGTNVAVIGTVTARFTVNSAPDTFYVQNPERTCGLRIAWTGSIAVGDMVEIVGTLGTTGDSERYLTAASVTGAQSVSSNVDPPLMAGRALGGSALCDSVTGVGQSAVEAWRWVKLDNIEQPVRKLGDVGGANNIGLLVKTTGKVTASGAGFFYMDDGSSYDEFETPDAAKGMPSGLKVALPEGATAPQAGSIIVVTGISSCYKSGSPVFRLLRVWRPEDIVTVIQ